MSLLIKALQKAEEGKNADAKPEESAYSLSLEELPRASSVAEDATPVSTPAEPIAAEPVVAEAEVPAEPSPPVINHQSPPAAQAATKPAVPADDKQELRQQAAVMFTAKTNEKKSNTTKKLLLISLMVFVAAAYGGLEFYTYLGSLNKPAIIMAKPAMPAAGQVQSSDQAVPLVEALPPELETKVSEMSQHPELDNAKEAVVSSVTTAMQKLDQALDQAKQKVTDLDQISTEPRKNRQVAPLSFGDPVSVSENTSVKVTKNNPLPRISPDIAYAYQAFNAGDDNAAQKYYRQALRSDVRNVDALLGMAAVAARQGRNEDALGWYNKVLEVEPRNTVAQAAMVAVVSQTDPVGSESRIKSLLAMQPESAYLYASLGSIYAEQNQWGSAQQAYFQAYHFDSNNADYAFNLAISLDQLGKSNLALQYYKQALELARKSGATGIDLAQLESRISQLQ